MERTFASWVREVAETLARDRAEVIAYARSAAAGSWDEASAAPAWRRREVLAHLAGGNDEMLQTVLRAVVAGERIDAATFEVDTDAENARRVAERAGWPIARLIEELERDGEETQELLSRLREGDRDVRAEGSAMTLGAFLRIVHEERHDRLHLEQMRV